MSRYDTPIEVAQVLAKHAPKSIESILDPSVGTGALLEPLAERLKNSAKQVVCIDIDKKALSLVNSKFHPCFGGRIEIVCKNFLEWSVPSDNPQKHQLFDCVVMNPPFGGQKSAYIKLDLEREMPGVGKGNRFAPIEAAFVLRSIRMLRPGGRLLSIVPASIVSSFTTIWLRNYLMQLGAIRYVHELPRFTFGRLEARIYLFVYEKQNKQQSIILYNHDLAKPESVIVRKEDLIPEVRFDYSFHRARHWYKTLRYCCAYLGWTQIKTIAQLYRGGFDLSAKLPNILHTCDYHDGVWYSEDRRVELKKDRSERGIRRGDLLVKRVGRRCAYSVGRVIGHQGDACSSCLLIIRPNVSAISIKLLFALRVLIASDNGALLVEHGTGATYLTKNEMLEIFIPIRLSVYYSDAYAQYRRAIELKRFDTIIAIENHVRRSLRLSIKRKQK